MTGADSRFRCPVCRAGFRGTRECSRCGADLEPLMAIAAKAWQARRSARQAIRRGDWEAAHRLAREARDLCATRAGQRLLLLSTCLTGYNLSTEPKSVLPVPG